MPESSFASSSAAEAAVHPDHIEMEQRQGELQRHYERRMRRARCKQDSPKAECPIEVVDGVKIIAADSVDGKVVDEVVEMVDKLVGYNKDIQENLNEADVKVIIIPRHMKMTDDPHFKSQKGNKTFDGRQWDEVRGTYNSGTKAIAVGEDTVEETKGAVTTYAGYSVPMHESAHAVHLTGMTSRQKSRLTELYEKRSRLTGPWTDAYASSDEREYFANATNAYFGENGMRGADGGADRTRGNSPDWLRSNDPDMYQFLLEIYGTPAR